MKTCMIFDLDGTLLDTLEDLYRSTNAALAQFGCAPRTKAEIRRFVGSGARNLIRQSLPGTAEDPDLEEVLSFYQVHYGAHSQDNTCPYPGIPEALARIAQEYPVAIVSNKPDGPVKTLCARFFPGRYALGETAGIPRKPEPDMVRKCMLDLGADRCIYIGDSDVDVITAKNAGAPCLSVTWGFRDMPELQAAGGKFFCHRTEDLPQILKQIDEETYGK